MDQRYLSNKKKQKKGILSVFGCQQTSLLIYCNKLFK